MIATTQPPLHLPRRSTKWLLLPLEPALLLTGLTPGLLLASQSMTPAITIKSSAVATPQIKSAISEQELPLNTLFPTLKQMQSLLSQQYFVCFGGRADDFFQSQNNVGHTMRHLWQKHPEIKYLKLQHPSNEGEGAVVYLHKCCKNLGVSCQLGAIWKRLLGDCHHCCNPCYNVDKKCAS